MRRPKQQSILGGCAASFILAAAASAQSAFEPPPVSDNAALQYWQAFGLLPALSAEQEKLLENWHTAPIDGAANTLLDQSQNSLKLLRRASKLRKCDWGLEYSDGISLLLPHLAKARTLARVAALDARRALEQGRMEAARDDLMAMMVMSRHVGADYTLISRMVACAMESMTIDVVAPYVPEIMGEYDAAVAMVQSLPPAVTVAEGVLFEKQCMAVWMIKELKAAEQRKPGSWRELWSGVLSGADFPDPIKNVESLEKAIAMMEDFLPVYDELARVVALPYKEFDAEYPAFVKRAVATSQAAEFLLPAMDKVIAAERRSEARMAMLMAAIAVVEGGPEKLAEIKDPFGDGPFEYRKLDAGFELSSKLVEDGKPVSLVIGQKE